MTESLSLPHYALIFLGSELLMTSEGAMTVKQMTLDLYLMPARKLQMTKYK